VSYSFLTRNAELDARTASYMPESIDPDYGLDKTFRLYDVENLRPETKEMVETWLRVYGDAKDVILGVEAAGN
jgi:arylsulfatase